MLWMRGFSDCWETASSASSRGSPAFTSVASWRVSSDRSEADMPRRREKLRSRLASPCLTSATVTGRSCRSRRICRTCLTVSPSTTPFCSRPAVSRAVYSKAPIGGADQSSRVTRRTSSMRGFAAQHLVHAVVANRRCQGARVALELVLGGAVVDHGAHLVIDDDQFVDAGTAAKADARVAGPVQAWATVRWEPRPSRRRS